MTDQNLQKKICSLQNNILKSLHWKIDYFNNVLFCRFEIKFAPIQTFHWSNSPGRNVRRSIFIKEWIYNTHAFNNIQCTICLPLSCCMCKTFIHYITLDNTDRVHRYNITTIHSQYTCIHKDIQLFVGLPKCNFLPLVLFIFGHQRCVCFFSPTRGCGLLVN